MCKQCTRGGCAFYFRNRGAPTNRPNHPNYSQLGFRVHPPTPLKRGFLALCFPLQLCRKCAFHSKTELKWITVGLLPKMCVLSAFRENWRGRPPAPAQKAPGPWCLPAWGPRLPCQNRPKTWVWGHSLLPDGKRSIAGLGHYSPRKPGGFTLPHRSDGTLGRGPRSEPRAPMQMVSGALGSLGLRVWGLGFRV